MSTPDLGRLRNCARAYERLMRGGLGAQAHTAGVDGFASEGCEYPYITAADVHALLDEIEAGRKLRAGVEALAETKPGATGRALRALLAEGKP